MGRRRLPSWSAIGLMPVLALLALGACGGDEAGTRLTVSHRDGPSAAIAIEGEATVVVIRDGSGAVVARGAALHPETLGPPEEERGYEVLRDVELAPGDYEAELDVHGCPCPDLSRAHEQPRIAEGPPCRAEFEVRHEGSVQVTISTPDALDRSRCSAHVTGVSSGD